MTATYANGVTRDVTKLMKMKDADKSLTAEDKSVTLVYCKGQTMYHNQQKYAGQHDETRCGYHNQRNFV